MVPWFECHINADGTYHTCGAQPNHISGTANADLYNVSTMSIPEWVNSWHQCNTRISKFNGHAEPLCGICYQEDSLGSSSKRVKENHKCNIHPVNFEKTFTQSPDYQQFEYSSEHNGQTTIRPVSYHISLGNECNLACRMCRPIASSKIAAEEIKLGLYRGPAKINWTNDQAAWKSVTEYVCETENLQFVHLIGGEPLLNPRFEQFVDMLIAAGQTNIYLGFTTNGTIFNKDLLEKLNQFRHVDIGVSIECTGLLNEYIRRGANTNSILSNLDEYLKYRKESHVYVTLRPVPSALSVHALDDLYRWCISRELDVMTNMLVRPDFMQIKNLPQNIKDRLLLQYSQWQFSDPFPGESNPRDPNRFKDHIDNEIRAVINALNQPGNPVLTEKLYTTLDSWGWFSNAEIKNYFI